MAQGVVAWMRGWRACVPPAPGAPAPAVAGGAGPAAEVVGVLAAMALACAGGD